MDILQWARAFAALIATLGLIALAAYVLRRAGMMQLRARGLAERRMKVVERLMLDPRRSLLLVRLDETEHLLLLSPGGDVAVAQQAARDPAPPPSENAAPEAQQ
jgi:flagellar protein FliO/FliZ